MAWNRSQESEPKPPARPASQGSKTSTLGPSISIQGELTGSEDLRIEGSVEGTIRFDEQSVVVSRSGRIKADIYGRSIRVEGRVKGNLYGEEEIIIRPSGQLEGNIMAPSVTLENGAMFRGAIDMEPAPRKRAESAAAKADPAPASESRKTTQDTERAQRGDSGGPDARTPAAAAAKG